MIYTRDESKIVLQLLVRRMIQDLFFIDEAVRQFQTAREATLPSQSVRAAITVLTIGPIVLVYPFLQRHFIKGVFAGSLKG
jgi:ABC-type glycerol-3-phosphate transport system permease component